MANKDLLEVTIKKVTVIAASLVAMHSLTGCYGLPMDNVNYQESTRGKDIDERMTKNMTEKQKDFYYRNKAANGRLNRIGPKSGRF